MNSSDEFFKTKFPFYVKWYIECIFSKNNYDEKKSHLNYINYWGIADSLQDALLLSSVNYDDSDETIDKTIDKKLDSVARFIETFTVRRAINHKKFGQTSIKYTMFNIIKTIRNNPIDKLCENLKTEIDNIEQKWDKIPYFCLHGQNRKFVKHLLSRITSYIDNLAGKSTTYVTYHHPQSGKPFEIEHIWADKFQEHKDEFDQEVEFRDWRNSIGALILLPNCTNQSFNSDDGRESYLF